MLPVRSLQKIAGESAFDRLKRFVTGAPKKPKGIPQKPKGYVPDTHSTALSPLLSVDSDGDFQRKSINRVDAWAGGLQHSGRKRAEELVSEAQRVRAADPSKFNFDPSDDPRKPISLEMSSVRNALFGGASHRKPSGFIGNTLFGKGISTVPGSSYDNSRATLLHETMHETNNSNGSGPVISPELNNILRETYATPVRAANSTPAQQAADRQLSLNYWRNKGSWETAPLLAEVRLALENIGVDTLNPKDVRKALSDSTLLDKDLNLPTRVKAFLQELHRELKSPEVVEELETLLPGIARNNQSVKDSENFKQAAFIGYFYKQAADPRYVSYPYTGDPASKVVTQAYAAMQGYADKAKTALNDQINKLPVVGTFSSKQPSKQ